MDILLPKCRIQGLLIRSWGGGGRRDAASGASFKAPYQSHPLPQSQNFLLPTLLAFAQGRLCHHAHSHPFPLSVWLATKAVRVASQAWLLWKPKQRGVPCLFQRHLAYSLQRCESVGDVLLCQITTAFPFPQTFSYLLEPNPLALGASQLKGASDQAEPLQALEQTAAI